MKSIAVLPDTRGVCQDTCVGNWIEKNLLEIQGCLPLFDKDGFLSK